MCSWRTRASSAGKLREAQVRFRNFTFIFCKYFGYDICILRINLLTRKISKSGNSRLVATGNASGSFIGSRISGVLLTLRVTSPGSVAVSYDNRVVFTL
jgi:hypothetical protein